MPPEPGVVSKLLNLQLPEPVEDILVREGLTSIPVLAAVEAADIESLQRQLSPLCWDSLQSTFIKAHALMGAPPAGKRPFGSKGEPTMLTKAGVSPEAGSPAMNSKVQRRVLEGPIVSRRKNILPIPAALPSSIELQASVDEFILQGLEWAARKQYARVETFYNQMLLPDEVGFPLVPNLIARFVYVLSKCGYAPSTIDSYTRSLRAVNSRKGFSLSQSGAFLCGAALRSARKMYQGPAGRKAPVLTSAQVRSLGLYAGCLQHIRVAALIAIFGLLRSDEVIGLSLTDVTFTCVGTSTGGCQNVRLYLHRSKTDGGGSFGIRTSGRGETVTIACIEKRLDCQNRLCPVHALLAYVNGTRPSSNASGQQELFLGTAGEPLTYTLFLSGLQFVVRSTQVTTHSCRRTGTQLLFRAGYSILHLCQYGRWRSGPGGAVLNYLDDVTACEVGNYAKSMVSVLSTENP